MNVEVIENEVIGAGIGVDDHGADVVIGVIDTDAGGDVDGIGLTVGGNGDGEPEGGSDIDAVLGGIDVKVAAVG